MVGAGQSLSELPAPEEYDYYAQSFEELVEMMCAGLEDYTGDA